MYTYFIAGTDTNIGKTAITCSLIAKYVKEGLIYSIPEFNI